MSPEGILFGYVEVDDRYEYKQSENITFILISSSFSLLLYHHFSLDEATKRMAKEEVNKRWQDSMAPFFETEGQHADKSFLVLKEVFHL